MKIRVKTEANVRARQPQAEGSLGFHSWRRKKRFSSRAFGARAGPCRHLDFKLPPSRAVRADFWCFDTRVCSALLWQPWETNALMCQISS